MNTTAIAAALGAARRSGEGWSCRCPAHLELLLLLSVVPQATAVAAGGESL
jgi:hypothetical protein